MLPKFLFSRSAGKIKYKYLFILTSLVIIVSLLFGGWASAQDLSDKKAFENKLKHYLQKAKEKIIPALEKPLNKFNEWLKERIISLKPNFYKELEEMKKSLLDLLQWGWDKGTKEVKTQI